MEDWVGFEPTLGLRRRVKSPVLSTTQSPIRRSAFGLLTQQTFDCPLLAESLEALMPVM